MSLFFPVSVSKELVDLVFMRLIWENILSTAAEECGKTAIVPIKEKILNYLDQGFPTRGAKQRPRGCEMVIQIFQKFVTGC